MKRNAICEISNFVKPINCYIQTTERNYYMGIMIDSKRASKNKYEINISCMLLVKGKNYAVYEEMVFPIYKIENGTIFIVQNTEIALVNNFIEDSNEDVSIVSPPIFYPSPSMVKRKQYIC